MATSKQHEETLKRYITELRDKGYKVIDLERKCPDAIAVKHNQIFAVEVLGLKYNKKKGWVHKWTYRSKKSIYHMFDDVLFKIFKHENHNSDVKKEGDKMARWQGKTSLEYLRGERELDPNRHRKNLVKEEMEDYNDEYNS